MSKSKQWDPDLCALKDTLVLAGPGGMTARQLAKRLRCSKPTIYARVERIRALGVVTIKTRKIREGQRGPKANAFVLL